MSDGIYLVCPKCMDSFKCPRDRYYSEKGIVLCPECKERGQ